jgi:hypothetical protein
VGTGGRQTGGPSARCRYKAKAMLAGNKGILRLPATQVKEQLQGLPTTTRQPLGTGNQLPGKHVAPGGREASALCPSSNSSHGRRLLGPRLCMRAPPAEPEGSRRAGRTHLAPSHMPNGWTAHKRPLGGSRQIPPRERRAGPEWSRGRRPIS